MALEDLKFQSTDFTGKDIASLPDRPNESGMTAAELKARFDYIPKMMIALGNYNKLIEALESTETGSSGADNIGASTISDIDGATVGAQLQSIKSRADALNAETQNFAAEQAAASKKYVDSVVLKAGAVESVNGKAGAVELTAVDVGAADNTLSNVVEIANWNTIRSLLGAQSNKNLLDNWYFADPIDQRGGYVIPPGVGYYIPGSWEQAGTTSGYVKVIRFWSDEAQDYPIISVDGTEYVLYPGNAVRGYTGAGYGVVRWIGVGSGTTLIESGFLRRIATNDYDSFLEFFEPKSFLGKNCTYSILAKWDGQGNQPYINVYSGDEVFIASAPIGEELNVYSCTFTFPTSMPTSDVRFGVGIVSMAGSTLDIYAAKLGLGSQQTLAHLENGVWVMNDPPPNKLIELLKCQYFYRLFATESARPKALADYHPPMRVNPATGTIDINGVTYYYADANL